MTRMVELAHPWQGHTVGATLELDEQTARTLVQSAIARYHVEPAAYPSEDVFPTADPVDPTPSATETVRGDAKTEATSGAIKPAESK